MSDYFNPSSSPKSIKVLIFLNVATFLLDRFTGGDLLIQSLSLKAEPILHDGEIWRLLTYGFLHDHSWLATCLAFNMLSLWMFGTPVAQAIGDKRVYLCYFGGLLFSGAASVFIYKEVVGSSGGIFAIVALFAILFPSQELLLLFVFPVRARMAVAIIAMVSFCLSNTGNLAHLTTLSGLLFGLLFHQISRYREERSAKVQVELHEPEWIVQPELDSVLKKIARSGMGSLTLQEREFLEKASDLKRRSKAGRT